MRLVRNVALLVSVSGSIGLAMLGGCLGILPQGSRDDVDLSREAFIREMVTAKNTRTTKHFNDYTPGSYHVNKLDLIEGVRALSDSLTKNVEAIIVTGPSSPLWTYHVITVMDSENADSIVRINHLVFPHARITKKSTKMMSREEYQQILERMLEFPILQSTTEADTSEWHTMVAVARFGSAETVKLVPDSLVQENMEEAESLFEYINALIKK